jgi:hypothetical protein
LDPLIFECPVHDTLSTAPVDTFLILAEIDRLIVPPCTAPLKSIITGDHFPDFPDSETLSLRPWSL